VPHTSIPIFILEGTNYMPFMRKRISKHLRNHAVNVTLVDNPNAPTEPEDDPNRDPFEGVEVLAAYSEVVKDFITHTAVTVGVYMAAYQIIKRICK
jgi:hypothetical protein